MNYHEGSWLTIGAAAPVLALSLTITLTRTVSLWNRQVWLSIFLYFLAVVGYGAAIVPFFRTLISLRRERDADMVFCQNSLAFCVLDVAMVAIFSGYLRDSGKRNAGGRPDEDGNV